MRLVVALVVVFGAACGASSSPTSPPVGATPEPVAAACTAQAANLSQQWLAAVDRADETESIRLAESIAPSAEAAREAPHPDYVTAFASAWTDPVFLTRPFNHWDYQSWSHARFFSNLAADVAGGEADSDGALFAAVTRRLRDPDPPNPGALWPYRIWQTGRGWCDRQAWVLCELAYQGGSDAKVAYLYDPGTDTSPHTIAQLRTNGRATAADPFSERAIYGVSIASVAADPALAQGLWPGNRRFQRGITAARLWVPSYPQDYARRNQLLHERLRRCLGPACPRFGEDPNRRMATVAAEVEGLPVGLWHYPVRILAWEMYVDPH